MRRRYGAGMLTVFFRLEDMVFRTAA